MILRFDGMTGAFVDRFVWDDPMTPKDETGGLSGPGAVLFGPDGDLFVSSFDSDAILRYDGASGAFVEVFVTAGSGGLDGPDAGMVFGPDGHLYVPGYYSDTIPRYDGDHRRSARRLHAGAGQHARPPAHAGVPGRAPLRRQRGQRRGAALRREHRRVRRRVRGRGRRAACRDPAGMVFDPDGVLHVAVDSNKVLRFDPDGAPLPTIVDAIAGMIAAPTHITLAPAQP
jgi:DNA-binding beta-propeller fold protein YncE